MFSEIQTIPDAAAEIKGSPEFPKIRGMVYFFGVHNGTIVAADIRNLPDGNAFHGFHIQREPVREQKRNPLHRRTDTTIRQMPCTRSMQEICLHFWQMTEMHF